MGHCKRNMRVSIRPLQLRILPEKVFSLFSFRSFSYKRNDWELPKGIISNVTQAKVFFLPFFFMQKEKLGVFHRGS